MFPSISSNNVADCRFWNSGLGNQVSVRHHSGSVFYSDLFHNLLRKFAHSVSFSSQPCLLKSSLLNRIVKVFLFRSKEQMIRITARRIIAGVTAKFSIRNLSMCLFPSKPRSCHQFSFDTKSSISSPFYISPIPTFVRKSLFHFGPKSINDEPDVQMFLGSDSSSNLQCSTGVFVSLTIFLHRSVRLICATLSARQSARALLFSQTTQ